MYDTPAPDVTLHSPEGRLILNMLALADYDCRRILSGDPGRAPSEQDVVNAISAARFLRSEWGRRLARVLGARPSAVESLRKLADDTIIALGVTPEFVDQLADSDLHEAVGLYRHPAQPLPAQARQHIDQPAFRFAA